MDVPVHVEYCGKNCDQMFMSLGATTEEYNEMTAVSQSMPRRLIVCYGIVVICDCSVVSCELPNEFFALFFFGR